MITENLSSSELVLIFQRVLVESGFLIISYESKINSFGTMKLKYNSKEFVINFNIRNIGSAYLPNKPNIMRRQVGKLESEDIPINSQIQVSMLLGLKVLDNTYILTCWNPFYFVGHKTNRSCYVLKESLQEAKENGFYDGVDCNTPVLACSTKEFSQLLSAYIERNSVD